MIESKSTVSARVPDAIKKVVKDSKYSHKVAYELGAGIIGMGKVEEAKEMIDNDPEYDKVVKEKKCELLEEKKRKLEKEIKDIDEKRKDA